MRRILMRSTLFLAVAIGCWQVMVGVSQGQTDVPQPEVQSTYYGTPAPMHPDLFYNYYPNTNVGINSAEMYPSPIPTPPVVGHTYYTYEALLPHEHMYSHKRVYYNYYGEGQFYTPGHEIGCPCQQCSANNPGGYGINKTTVTWQHGPFSFLQNPGIHHVGFSFRSGLGMGTGLLNGKCRSGLGANCRCGRGGCRGGNCQSGNCKTCN